MFADTSIGTPALWVGFTAFVVVMLFLDLGVFHRREHTIRMREAITWTIVWITLALVFNAGIWWSQGATPALEFLTGYLIEKALSVDNLFVFLVIFAYFKVPSNLQHRVLFWGVLGALVMRAIFILLGWELLEHFHWMMYVFGAFLIFTGIKLLVQREDHFQPDKSLAVRAFRRVIPSVKEYHGKAFFVREAGQRLATPLLLVLLTVEVTDIMFAVDSIPAIFAITKDPFIVYTSNIFAILGLRALYFVLAGMMDKFHYLKIGLALVLSFVGAKMLIVAIDEGYKKYLPTWASLAVVAVLLGASVGASLLRSAAQAAPAAANQEKRKERRKREKRHRR